MVSDGFADESFFLVFVFYTHVRCNFAPRLQSRRRAQSCCACPIECPETRWSARRARPRPRHLRRTRRAQCWSRANQSHRLHLSPVAPVVPISLSQPLWCLLRTRRRARRRSSSWRTGLATRARALRTARAQSSPPLSRSLVRAVQAAHGPPPPWHRRPLRVCRRASRGRCQEASRPSRPSRRRQPPPPPPPPCSSTARP